MPPLLTAAKQGNAVIVQHLLQHGSSIETCSSTNETALHFAARHCHKPVVEVLCKSGGDTEAINKVSEMFYLSFYLYNSDH